jgi:hypothetical protein
MIKEAQFLLFVLTSRLKVLCPLYLLSCPGRLQPEYSAPSWSLLSGRKELTLLQFYCNIGKQIEDRRRFPLSRVDPATEFV